MRSRPTPHNLWGTLRSYSHTKTPSLAPCWSILCQLSHQDRHSAATYLLHEWSARERLCFEEGADILHLLDIASWAAPMTFTWHNLHHASWRQDVFQILWEEEHTYKLHPEPLTTWFHDVLETLCLAFLELYRDSPDHVRIHTRLTHTLQDLQLARAHLSQGVVARTPDSFHLGGDQQILNHLWSQYSWSSDVFQIERFIDGVLQHMGQRLEPKKQRPTIQFLWHWASKIPDEARIVGSRRRFVRALVSAVCWDDSGSDWWHRNARR